MERHTGIANCACFRLTNVVIERRQTCDAHYARRPLREFAKRYFGAVLTPFLSQEPAAQLIRQTARQQWKLLALNLATSVLEAFSEGASLAVVFLAVQVLSSDGIMQALDVLDERSRRIVEERWLKVNDDGSGGMTLHELAAEYGVSAERIRQIEVAAMKKMKASLAEFA